MAGATGVYPTILGERFGELAPVLQQFHGASETRTVSGIFCVQRSGGWLGERLADGLGLPRAAEEVTLRLEVRRTPEGEEWVRHFGSEVFQTQQFSRAGLLIERIGRTEVELVLGVEDAGLSFRSVSARVAGVLIPGVLAPKIESRAEPVGDGWRVCVRMSVPFCDPLVEYSGMVGP